MQCASGSPRRGPFQVHVSPSAVLASPNFDSIPSRKLDSWNKFIHSFISWIFYGSSSASNTYIQNIISHLWLLDAVVFFLRKWWFPPASKAANIFASFSPLLRAHVISRHNPASVDYAHSCDVPSLQFLMLNRRVEHSNFLGSVSVVSQRRFFLYIYLSPSTKNVLFFSE